MNLMQKIIIYRGIFPDGKSYIGCTNNLKRRLSEHKSRFKGSRHHKETPNFYRSCGFDFEQIKWEVLDNTTEDKKYELETYYIKKYDSIKNGHNSGYGGVGTVGSKHTKERIEQRNNTRKKNMPFFKVEKKSNGHYLISNCYEMAGKFTGQSPISVRKKLRNNRPCSIANYTYVAGGEL